MLHIHLTDRTRDAFERAACDIVADPTHYEQEPENRDLQAELFTPLLDLSDDETLALTIQDARLVHAAVLAYLVQLDFENASHNDLAPGAHVLTILEGLGVETQRDNWYPLLADHPFEDAPLVLCVVRNDLFDQFPFLFKALLSNHALHDRAHKLRRRHIGEIRRAVLRANIEAVHDDATTSWWVTRDVLDNMSQLVATALEQVKNNPRFEVLYNQPAFYELASELARFTSTPTTEPGGETL